MTLPYERTRSVIQARDFLVDLSLNVALPEDVRRQAKHLLRHYPTKQEMFAACNIEGLRTAESSLKPIFGRYDED